MSNQYTISDIGLRLIKAYEGFASNGQTIRDGRKLVGYGRATHDASLKLSESQAETLLLEDLVTIENAVNGNVHAAISQSQFDALCSLAYSIGVEAFLDSDVLHALNRGEVITAANAFDGWRLGNIDGQIYVVDALVRRRTAEKALFLRPSKLVPAPHEVLKALRDDNHVTERVAQTTLTTGQKTASSNIVPLPDRADALEKTAENETNTDAEIIHLNDPLETPEPSPIAEAAAEVSDRLDALMDRDTSEESTDKEDWPDSLIENDDSEFNPASFQEENYNSPEAEFVDDVQDADGHGRYASADKYIESSTTGHTRQNFWAYVTMIILGLTMGGAGFLARMRGDQFFGEFSRLAWSAVFAIGVLMLIMGLYYLVKHLFSDAS